jgi:hypothetical protein
MAMGELSFFMYILLTMNELNDLRGISLYEPIDFLCRFKFQVQL